MFHRTCATWRKGESQHEFRKGRATYQASGCVSTRKEDVEKFRAEGVGILSLLEEFIKKDVSLICVGSFHGVLLEVGFRAMSLNSIVDKLICERMNDLNRAPELTSRKPFDQATGLEILGHFVGDINECFDKFSCGFHLVGGVEDVG